MTPEPPAGAAAPALPDVLPVLPLRGAVVLPRAMAPLAIGQEPSLRLVDDVMRGDRLVGLFLQRGEGRPASAAELHAVGTAARIQ